MTLLEKDGDLGIGLMTLTMHTKTIYYNLMDTSLVEGRCRLHGLFLMCSNFGHKMECSSFIYCVKTCLVNNGFKMSIYFGSEMPMLYSS